MASLVLEVMVAGCGSDERAVSPRRDASAMQPSLSARAVAEAQAMTAYDGMWQAMATAGQVPDPDAPELRRYATGDALARVVAALVSYRENGQVTRGRPVSHANVASATPPDDPAEVNIVDCGDSTNWTTHTKATGEQISPDPRGRRRITAVVKKIDGSWKVAAFNVREIGSC
jgi:ketosteroid isomerase-like protein